MSQSLLNFSADVFSMVFPLPMQPVLNTPLTPLMPLFLVFIKHLASSFLCFPTHSSSRPQRLGGEVGLQLTGGTLATSTRARVGAPLSASTSLAAGFGVLTRRTRACAGSCCALVWQWHVSFVSLARSQLRTGILTA